MKRTPSAWIAPALVVCAVTIACKKAPPEPENITSTKRPMADSWNNFEGVIRTHTFQDDAQ